MNFQNYLFPLSEDRKDIAERKNLYLKLLGKMKYFKFIEEIFFPLHGLNLNEMIFGSRDDIIVVVSRCNQQTRDCSSVSRKFAQRRIPFVKKKKRQSDIYPF